VHQHDSTFNFPFQTSDVTQQDATKYWKEAKKALKKYQLEARELRYRSYEDLLDHYESDIHNPESARRASIVRRTIRNEKCRETYRQIRMSVKPYQESPTGGIQSILIPANENDAALGKNGNDIYSWLVSHPEGPPRWKPEIERSEVERLLLSYNFSSFRAAAKSPCGHGPIYDAVTFSSLSPSGNQIISDGTAPSTWYGNNELLREFLRSFMSPVDTKTGKNAITTTITEDDVKKGFGKWREMTSTSPSGRHLGHYKSIIQDSVLLQCLTKFLDTISQRGSPISRWHNAINVMLEKDSGRPRINRLRIIHLFEADFNFYLKLMWGHRLVRQAQQLDLLHAGQYGSVPGRMAIELHQKVAFGKGKKKG
jgi:hypothetical protein